MNYRAVHHVALYTAQFQRLYDFYVNALGFHEIGGFAGHPIVFLEGGGIVLELAGDETPAEPRGQGWSHLAFEVDDLDTAVAELAVHGIAFHYGPLGYPPEAPTVRMALFRDPDGNELEIIQPLGRRYPSRTS